MGYRLSRKLLWPGVALTLLLVAGGVAAGIAAGSSAEPAENVSQLSAGPAETSTGSAGAFQDPIVHAAAPTRTGLTPTRVEMPAIGVDAPLEQLALDAGTNELTPPVEWQSAGWYSNGTVPGDIGPAVIAGHVDSVTAPAVFARLRELAAGDEIRVTMSTGAVTTFVVDSVDSAPKDAFPTEKVYGPTPSAQLRVITCDGAFNGATGHYLDNLIVFASLKTE